MSRAYPPRKKTRSSARSSPSGTFGWMLFGILIGLCVAIFGYWKLVIAPTQQGSSLPVTQPQTTHKTAAPVKKEQPAATVVTAPEFDFYTVLPKMEVAATTKDGVPAKSPSPPPTPPATPPVAAPTTPTMAAPAVPVAAPVAAATPPIRPAPPTILSAVAETKIAAPAVVKQPPVEPVVAAAAEVKTPAPKPATSSAYVLQLGIFKNYAEADRLKAALTMSGLEVSIQPYTRNAQVYNRVIMGPYPSKAAASEQRTVLQKNKISSMVVKAS